MTFVLRVEQARRSFGATAALQGLDLSLRRGEWLALLGPNGAGKTTLVRAIAGRVRLDGGSIELLGTRLDERGASHVRQRLGIVPQDIALYPSLTPRENLQAFGRFQGVVGAELRRRIVEALDWSGLAERADEPIRSFSGGMKRRLNIACAVLHKPEVLLLDEPTVGVDPQSRERIWEMLGELRKDGATLLLTTHQLDEAQQVCDRIVIVDHGKVVADGTLDELVGQTIGHQGHLTLQIDRPLEPGHPLLTRWQPAEDGRSLSGAVEDPAADLPAALKSLDDADRRVLGLRLEPPSLQAVFLHLTGRELRE
ncbi:MAG TPA: ABC transporter ATP-binding protein [Acidobacteria bacterium]|nr:ABC transporter ATP-binding protein [Acidobacteriota bacterium]